MTKLLFQLSLFIIAVHHPNVSLANETKQERIFSQSQQFAEAVRRGHPEGLKMLFDVNGCLLPEYHQALCGPEAIFEYYTGFMQLATTLTYTKEPFEIQAIGELYLELGTYEHRYKPPKGHPVDYTGKYMTYWKFQANGTPKILAHIWGASSHFEAENVDFIRVESREAVNQIPNTPWTEQIEEMRLEAYEAVLQGDAKKQSKAYAQDAVYGTYYDPFFMGKEAITQYYFSHYTPEVQRDSLMTRAVKVIELGKYALKFGAYYVAWTYDHKPYYIRGKGLTLYRRKADGQLEIYRQMINHSMPPTEIDQ